MFICTLISVLGESAAQSLASLGRMSGVNFIAFAMLPLIFILPYKWSKYLSIKYSHEGLLGVQFSLGESYEVVIKHYESGVWLSFLALGDLA